MATRRDPKKQPIRRSTASTPKRTTSEHPGERADDVKPEQLTWTKRFHIYAKENWYRDVWMAILTLVVIVTVTSSQSTSNEAKSAVQQVQQERIASIVRACESQNRRHDATISTLNSIYNHPAKPLALKGVNPQITFALNLLVQAQRTSGRGPTIFLINALAPKTANCNKYARRSVQTTVPTN